MTEAATKAASSEVLQTHKGLKGEALTSYLGTYNVATFPPDF